MWKTIPSYVLLTKIYLKCRIIERLNVKRWKKIHNANTSPKKFDIAVPLSPNKADFKARNITRDGEKRVNLSGRGDSYNFLRI